MLYKNQRDERMSGGAGFYRGSARSLLSDDPPPPVDVRSRGPARNFSPFKTAFCDSEEDIH